VFSPYFFKIIFFSNIGVESVESVETLFKPLSAIGVLVTLWLHFLHLKRVTSEVKTFSFDFILK